MPAILGYGAFTSVVLAVFDFTGASLRGKRPEIEGMDEFERKEHLRRNRRRPIEETLANVGEGRGMYSVLTPINQFRSLKANQAQVSNHPDLKSEGGSVSRRSMVWRSTQCRLWLHEWIYLRTRVYIYRVFDILLDVGYAQRKDSL